MFLTYVHGRWIGPGPGLQLEGDKTWFDGYIGSGAEGRPSRAGALQALGPAAAHLAKSELPAPVEAPSRGMEHNEPMQANRGLTVCQS